MQNIEPAKIFYLIQNNLQKLISFVRYHYVRFTIGRYNQREDDGYIFLKDFLKDPNEHIRELATKELARYPWTEKAIEPLLEALKDANPSVRNIAADALCRYPYPQIPLPIINTFGEDDPELMDKLPTNLAELDETTACGFLINLLRHKNKYVRWAALALLGQTKTYHYNSSPIIAMLKDDYYRNRELAVKTLKETSDPEIIEPLIQVLISEEEFFIRSHAGQALETFGELAVEPLVKLLKHPNSQVRWDGAYRLGLIGSSKAVGPLIESLNDLNPFARAGIIDSLGKIGNEKAIAPLIKLLQTGDTRGREGAAKALGTLKAKEAVTPLIVALKDKDSSVRRKAAMALGEIGDKIATEPLIAVLEDNEVRGNAALALGQIGDSRAVEPVRNLYRDNDPQVRWSVAKALGKLGEPSVLPILEWMVEYDKGSDPKGIFVVRDAACEAIAEIKLGKDLALETLIAALKHEDSSVRALAALKLAKLKEVRAIPFLEEMARYDEGKGCKSRSLKEIADYAITLIKASEIYDYTTDSSFY